MEVATRRASKFVLTTLCLAIAASTDAQVMLGHREQSPPSHHRAGYTIEQFKVSQETGAAEASIHERLQGSRKAELEGYNKLIQKEPIVGDGPQYEVVISRWNEAMDWIAQIPLLWDITIYNKGHDDLPNIPGRPYSSVLMPPDIGAEVTSYAEHLVRRYYSLATYTVFTQADPFPHSPFFIDLLRSPSLLSTVQSLSLWYKHTGEFRTPREVVDQFKKHPWFRSERASTRTLNSVYFHDVGTPNLANEYLAQHNVTVGTNLIAHQLRVIGLEGWMPESQEVASFAWGGIFGTHISKILQHPRSVYEAIKVAGTSQPINKFIYEHSWMVIFGGPDIKDV